MNVPLYKTTNLHSNGLPSLGKDPFLLEEKPVDLRLLLYKYLLRYWYLYALGLLLALSIAYLQLRYATKQYLVRGTVLIKSTDTNSADDLSQEAVLGELGISPVSRNVQNEIQILKSRTLMQEVIQRLKAYVIYELEGRIVSGEQYLDSPVLLDTFVLNPKAGNFNIELQRIDNRRLAVMKGDEVVKELAYGDTLQNDRGMFVFKAHPESRWSDNRVIIRFRDPETIAQSYANRLNAKIIAEWSSVVELSLKDPVPQKAADIINTLIEVYNEAAVKDKNRSAESTYQFINERLRLLTAELSEAEGEVEQFKTRNVIPSDINANVGTYLSEFNANDNELSRLRLQESILNNLENSLASDLNSYELLPLNAVVDNNELLGQINQYNRLIQERKRQLLSLRETHPRILQINDEIASSKIVILATVRDARSNLQRIVRQLQEKNRQLQVKLRNIPSIERDLLEITRQKNIKENLYLFLLQKREETAISMSVAVSNARILDAAKPSGGPIEPKSNLYYTIALVLGLGLPLGFVVASDLLNDTVQTSEDIKNTVQLPLLGTIGLSNKETNIVVRLGSRSAIAEMFRMLRTNLQFLLGGQATPPVILVTSGASGEGKTFVTVNLAMSMAISGKKTVIVSLDLRKPKVGRYLEQTETDRGITNFFIGEAQIEDIIRPSSQHDLLYFVPSGPIPPNPAELILQDRTVQLFDYLRSHFDFILIDSPPVGVVSDALLLNEFLTGTLFIVRYGQTKKGMLRFAEDLGRDKKLRNLSLVFNGVKARGKYGYGYGYGYGYYEEEKKKNRWLSTKKEAN